MEKILDAHVHCSLALTARELDDFLNTTGTAKACLLACAHSRCLSLVPRAMESKLLFPGKYYVFGAPDASAYFLRGGDIGQAQKEYCAGLMAMGCDGIKLLEGKPQVRKLYPIPDFDLPVWEPFWQWAEEEQVPILWHVNDPANFWDTENAPVFAKSCGWVYDESYINNEVQYAQVIRVLERHPKLSVCFAHFFFMSGSLERLSDILDRYEGVCIDLTPGIEMYEDFSADTEKTRAFFGKYQDRIFYGTDIGGRCVLEGENKPFDPLENTRRPRIVRRFLSESGSELIESDSHYLIGRAPFTMNCLGLSEEILAKIYAENFESFAGAQPRAADADALEGYKTELKKKLDEMAL